MSEERRPEVLEMVRGLGTYEEDGTWRLLGEGEVEAYR